MTKALVSCVLGLAAAGLAAPTAPAARGCTSPDLSGSFTAIPGTNAAGSVEYALTFTNASRAVCTLTRRPTLQLLASTGAVLPTHASPAQASEAVTLPPLATAAAIAVLAVDVPGPGDVQQPGRPCEPRASRIRVGAAGGTTLSIPLAPPASVCRRGAITVRPFTALERQAIPAGLFALIHSEVRFPVYEYTVRIRFDPDDASWVEWSFGPSGRQFPIQGAFAFAHRTAGRWRDVSGPGSAGVCAAVPTVVVHAFGMSGC